MGEKSIKGKNDIIKKLNISNIDQDELKKSISEMDDKKNHQKIKNLILRQVVKIFQSQKLKKKQKKGKKCH